MITGEPSGMEDSAKKCFYVVGYEKQQGEGEKIELIPIKCENTVECAYGTCGEHCEDARMELKAKGYSPAMCKQHGHPQVM